MSGPKASVPPAPNSDGEHGEQAHPGPAVRDAVPPAPSAASTARVAPIRTGATTGSKAAGEGSPAPVRRQRGRRRAYRPTASPQVAASHVVTSSDHAEPAGPRRRRARRRARASSASSTASWTARAIDLPRNTPPGVDAGGAQRVERAVARSRRRTTAARATSRQNSVGQPDQARARLRSISAGRRSRAKANITITIAGERQHLVERDAAAPLDAQVLARRSAERAPTHASLPASPARSWTCPPTTSTHAGGQRAGPVELVAGDDHRRARRRGLAQRWRRGRRGRRRRGRRAARRAATARPAGRPGRRARCAAAARPTGAAPAASAEAAGEAEAVERGRDLVGRRRRPWRPRSATFSATVRSRYRPLRGRAGRPGERTASRSVAQVAAEHRRRRRGPAARGRRTAAAASSCRRRWGRAAARSRRAAR